MFGLDMGETSLDLFSLLMLAKGDPLLENVFSGGDRAGEDFCFDVGGSLISGRFRLFTCLGAGCLDVVFNGFVFGVTTFFCFRETAGSESEVSITS